VHGFTGTAPRTPARAAAGAYASKSSPASASRTFPADQRRGAVSSVALDPTTGALLLDTDSLGEIA
jgi:hypothetical protein